jgi:NAD(P)H-nitrite reductase large subunit
MALMDRTLDLGPCLPEEDDDLVVCRCEEITKGDVRRAVHDGFRSLTEVRRYLRAGMGLCQGQTCGRIVKAIVERELHAGIAVNGEPLPRAPMRPVLMSIYGNEVIP